MSFPTDTSKKVDADPSHSLLLAAQRAQESQKLLQAQQIQLKQQQLQMQQRLEEEKRKKAEEEFRKALEDAPRLDVPWQLLESSASKSRIRALARSLDPSMELDEGAVQLVDDLLGKWVEEVTSLGAEVAEARSRALASLPSNPQQSAASLHQNLEQQLSGAPNSSASSAFDAARIPPRPILNPQDLQLVLSEIWPATLGLPSTNPWERSLPGQAVLARRVVGGEGGKSLLELQLQQQSTTVDASNNIINKKANPPPTTTTSSKTATSSGATKLLIKKR